MGSVSGWAPGYPCAACGSTRTGWEPDVGAFCLACGRSDADEHLNAAPASVTDADRRKAQQTWDGSHSAFTTGPWSSLSQLKQEHLARKAAGGR